MSTTLNRPTRQGTSPHSSPSFGTLARVVLRLHRGALLTWVAVVVLVGAGLVWLRWVGVSVVLPGPLECWVGPGCGPQEAVQESEMTHHIFWLDWVSVLLLALPVAVAAWAGTALTGAEQERGTAALAWTQSVSPRRWIAVKWAVAGGVLIAGASSSGPAVRMGPVRSVHGRVPAGRLDGLAHLLRLRARRPLPCSSSP